MYGYFRQRWKDSRLAGRLNYSLTLKGADIENVWLPDPYCYNAHESNMMVLDTIHNSTAGSLLIPMEMYSTAKGKCLTSENQIFSQAVNQSMICSVINSGQTVRQTADRQADGQPDRQTD